MSELNTYNKLPDLNRQFRQFARSLARFCFYFWLRKTTIQGFIFLEYFPSVLLFPVNQPLPPYPALVQDYSALVTSYLRCTLEGSSASDMRMREMKFLP